MTTTRVLAAATLLACSPLIAWADDTPPPPPPQHEWIGKGQFGFLDSKGNADAESINGNIDMTRYDGTWKNEAYAAYLYGKSAGIVAAERIDAREQTNYDITSRLYTFGALRYEHDLFDGFQYQASLVGGMGYKFLDSKSDQLTVQVGAGYRRLRPESITKDDNGAVTARIPEQASGEAIGVVGIDYKHVFTPTTTLTNKFLMEYGSDNTLVHDEIALAVKMSTKLALVVGYATTDNSNPPAPLKKIDSITTVNLQFAF